MTWLDWSETAKQFSVKSREKFLSQDQAGRPARTQAARTGAFLSQNFRYFSFFSVVSLVKYTFLFVLGKCFMDSEQVFSTFTEVWPYNFYVSW